MEEEDRHELLKHVCRLCKKRFPNGKSLGGHMRSHVIANSYGSLQKLKSSNGREASTFDGESESKRERESGLDCANHAAAAAGSGGYGLRENPKKAWRFANASFNPKQESVCNQCGKSFQSIKALCGHMSCHSGKERTFSKLVDDDDDDDSWTNEEDEEDEEEEEDEDGEFVMESRSDIVVGPASSKRPKRLREETYKNVAVDSFSLANASSSFSEIEQEKEEVAKCLMMLSRDYGQRSVTVVGSGVNFMAEASDNNSVILECGSSSNHVGVVTIKDLKHGSNGSHCMEMELSAAKKLKCVEMDNSDSGYFENGAKALESDGSVDGFSRTYGYKKPEIASGSRAEASVQFQKTEYEVDRAQSKLNLKGRNRSALDCPEVEDSPSKMIKHDSVSFQAPVQRAGKYECSICHEVFDTHQALGGHKMKHKKAGGCGLGSRQGKDELILEKGSSRKSDDKTSEKKAGSKKIRVHKCPYCPKFFKSGQALGGHKRSHLIGGGSLSQERANLAPPVKEKPSLLDLNLPAPVEEDANGHAQFMPW